MGKLKSFQIDFDNVQGVFAPGQTITGRAVVDLESEMKMKGTLSLSLLHSFLDNPFLSF